MKIFNIITKNTNIKIGDMFRITKTERSVTNYVTKREEWLTGDLNCVCLDFEKRKGMDQTLLDRSITYCIFLSNNQRYEVPVYSIDGKDVVRGVNGNGTIDIELLYESN